MSVQITNLLLVCMAVWIVLAVVSLVRNRSWRSFAFEAGLLAVVFVALTATTSFPAPSRRIAFGGQSTGLLVALMFVCVILGMAARYVFYLRGPFSWLSFLKPICVTPIILLPLLGTVQGTADLEMVQILSFLFLAFQNGFFWRVVFERAKTQL